MHQQISLVLVFPTLIYPFFGCLQLVELKNGETYNGHLVNCDSWMNIHLREVICTSKVGFSWCSGDVGNNWFCGPHDPVRIRE